MAKSTQATAPKSMARGGRKDNFAVYAAIFAVTLLGVLSAFYFFLHSGNSYQPKAAYLPLPQLVYEANDQVAQVEVIVQVNEKDQEWMQKNNAEINEIFKKTIQEIDPATFRSKEGSEAVLVKLKDAINGGLKVNKVEAVLYKDMILQHKVE